MGPPPPPRVGVDGCEDEETSCLHRGLNLEPSRPLGVAVEITLFQPLTEILERIKKNPVVTIR